MQQLFLICWQICLFKKGPQAMPSAASLLILLVGVGTLLDVASINFANPNFSGLNGILAELIYNGCILALTAVMLHFFGYAQRVVQTLNAIFGSGIIMTLFSLPLLLMLQGSMQNPDTGGSGGGLLLMGLEIWHLFILANILRFAFSVSLLLGLMMSLGYLLLGVQIATLFY